MEKLRKFERSCLRTALHKFRTDANPEKYISNKIIYNIANISRIDNFIIKLSRDYFLKTKTICNPIIKGFSSINKSQIKLSVSTGYFPPQAFMFFDNARVIQNNEGVPLIFHISRHQSNKALPISKDSINQNNLVYSTSVPDIDTQIHNAYGNYWWLHQNRESLEDWRRRARFR